MRWRCVTVICHDVRALRLFKRCTSPLKSSCRQGVKMLLNYQPDLHKYLLKMNIICRRHIVPGSAC